MTENNERAQFGWRFWLWWVLASMVAFLVAYPGAATVARAVEESVGQVVGSAVSGAVFGASLGIAQWLVLRRQFSRPGRWVLASTAGSAAAFTVGHVAGEAVGTVVFGASIGTAQWFVLRRWQVSRPGRWVLASIVAFAVFSTLEPNGFAMFTLGGAAYGAITGGVMVWLLRRPIAGESIAVAEGALIDLEATEVSEENSFQHGQPKEVAMSEIEQTPGTKKEETNWARNPIVVLLVVLVVLNLANLALTFWLGTDAGNNQGQTTTAQELPATLTKVERDSIFQRFQGNYNSDDFDAVYEMYDPFVKVQIDRELHADQVESLHTFFGQIEEGVYSHYEYTDSSSGRDWFNLYYRVKYKGGDFSSGILTITVLDDGREYGIAGFNLETD